VIRYYSFALPGGPNEILTLISFLQTWDFVVPEVDSIRVERSYSTVKLTKMERVSLDLVNQMTLQDCRNLVIAHNEKEVGRKSRGGIAQPCYYLKLTH
jgi:hypothetical protein